MAMAIPHFLHMQSRSGIGGVWSLTLNLSRVWGSNMNTCTLTQNLGRQTVYWCKVRLSAPDGFGDRQLLVRQSGNSAFEEPQLMLESRYSLLEVCSFIFSDFSVPTKYITRPEYGGS